LQDTLYDKRKLVFKQTFIVIFLLITSFSIYIPSINNEFVWDDNDLISSFQDYEPKFDFEFIYKELSDRSDQFHFRPIFYNSVVTDYKIWKLTPFGYHLTNVILNCLVNVLLYIFALTLLSYYRISNASIIAFFSSLFFTVYPLHVENVSFIGARADLFSTFFLLFAFLFHIKFVGRWYLVLLGGLFYFLSLMSKELGACFLIIVLGFDILNKRFFIKSSIFRYSTYVFFTILYFFFRARSALSFKRILVELFGIEDSDIEINVNHSDKGNEEVSYGESDNVLPEDISIPDADIVGFPLFEKLQSIFEYYLYYVEKLFYPYDLNPFFNVGSEGTWYFVLSVLIIVTIISAFFILIFKKHTFIPFLLLWIFAGLGPGILVGILNIGATNVAERFTYFSTCAFCILLAYLIFVFSDKLNMKKLGIALSLILVLSYTITTVRGQEKWKNNDSFWKANVEKNPMNPVGYIGYGSSLRESGKPYEAIKNYLFALGDKMKSDELTKGMLSENLAVAYMDTGDLDASERWFSRAKRYYGDVGGGTNFYYQLGLLYFQKGEQRERQGFFELYNYMKAENYLKKNILKRGRARSIDFLLMAEVEFKLGKKLEAAKYAQLAMQRGINPEHYKRAVEILNKSLFE